MNAVFVTGVELGCHALRGLLDSTAYASGEIRLSAVIGLDEEKSAQTVGYRSAWHLSQKAGIPFHCVNSITTEQVFRKVTQMAPDLIFIIGWSELARSEFLDIPKTKHCSAQRHGCAHGCIGMHPTLLPYGRGRAPIPWSIIHGLPTSGVTMFYLEDEADAGDIIAQREFPIEINDDAFSVYAMVADLHYAMMRDTVPLLVQGTAGRTAQDASTATVWRRRTPEDGIIDWRKGNIEQYNWIRALTHPYPGARTLWRGRMLTIWKAKPRAVATSACPGSVIALSHESVTVACSVGAVDLFRLQMEDEPELDAGAFAARYGLDVMDSFGAAEGGGK